MLTMRNVNLISVQPWTYPASRFSDISKKKNGCGGDYSDMDRKKFENGWRHDNHVILRPEFSSNTNPNCFLVWPGDRSVFKFL